MPLSYSRRVYRVDLGRTINCRMQYINSGSVAYVAIGDLSVAREPCHMCSHAVVHCVFGFGGTLICYRVNV